MIITELSIENKAFVKKIQKDTSFRIKFFVP